MSDYGNYERCMVDKCLEKTTHYSGKCKQHRITKCAILGCKEMVLSKQASRYCKKHQARKRPSCGLEGAI